MVKKVLEEEYIKEFIKYAKANNKYMKDSDENKESSYLKYWDANNLYVWAMSQKLQVNKFEWIEYTSQYNEDLKRYKKINEKNTIKKMTKDIISKLMFDKKLYEFINDLRFLPVRMKIEKVEKPVTNLDDKIEYAIHIRNLNQALNHKLILKNVHRVIKYY